MLVKPRKETVKISTTLLRIVDAVVSLIAAPHVIEVTDKKTKEEVVDAHLGKDEEI